MSKEHRNRLSKNKNESVSHIYCPVNRQLVIYHSRWVINKKYKEAKREVSNLVNASTHWLASLKSCPIRVFWMIFNRFLQSMRRGSNRRIAGELFISCTIDRASSPIIKLVFPRVDTKINPSLKAHSSTIYN